jgi:galactokinase
MDQAVILLAQAGAALHIDFFPLRATPVALPADHVIVVCDSLERAEKAGAARAAYNRRVVECRLATRILAHALAIELERLADLRTAFPATAPTDFVAVLAERIPDAPLSLAEIAAAAGTRPAALAPLLEASKTASHAGTVQDREPADAGACDGYRPLARARHVLGEARRVEQAVAALAAGDAAAFGALMAASHASCRDDYDISTPALEALVDTAARAGALGTRLTGAGFGGCAVSLVRADEVERFLDTLDRRFYRPRLPPSVDPARHRHVFTPSAGATATAVSR